MSKAFQTFVQMNIDAAKGGASVAVGEKVLNRIMNTGSSKKLLVAQSLAFGVSMLDENGKLFPMMKPVAETALAAAMNGVANDVFNDVGDVPVGLEVLKLVGMEKASERAKEYYDEQKASGSAFNTAQSGEGVVVDVDGEDPGSEAPANAAAPDASNRKNLEKETIAGGNFKCPRDGAIFDKHRNFKVFHLTDGDSSPLPEVDEWIGSELCGKCRNKLQGMHNQHLKSEQKSEQKAEVAEQKAEEQALVDKAKLDELETKHTEISEKLVEDQKNAEVLEKQVKDFSDAGMPEEVLQPFNASLESIRANIAKNGQCLVEVANEIKSLQDGLTTASINKANTGSVTGKAKKLPIPG